MSTFLTANSFSALAAAEEQQRQRRSPSANSLAGKLLAAVESSRKKRRTHHKKRSSVSSLGLNNGSDALSMTASTLVSGGATASGSAAMSLSPSVEDFQEVPAASSTDTAMAPEKSVLPVNAVVVVEPPLPASLAKPVQQDVNTASVNSSTDAVNAQHIPANNADHDELEEAPLLVLVTTYVSFIILIVFGHLRDFIGKRLKPSSYNHLKVADGYAPLTSDFESFYTRRLYKRVRDCWNRPITGVPGRTVTLLERASDDFNETFRMLGTTNTVLNLSSYNYLGFAQSEGQCADDVDVATKQYRVGMAAPRFEGGTNDLHVKLEKLVARFVGKEDSIVISMGFATNSTTLPALVEKGSLIISDELNHSSLVFGARLSKATIRIFKHNDITDLESVLRDAIAQGQPRTHRPWKKILVVVEGLYSMEGSIVKLPEIVELKKKYNFYLYVDEAHSIGALGPHGGGVCDYFGVDPREVDILMGTFTKSFGAAGGYVAASREIVAHLRARNHGSVYAESMTPPVVQQVLTSMKVILGEDGTTDGKHRLTQINDNSRFFRQQLRKLGFIVYGHDDSPVIPMLLFNPAKIAAFSREMLERGVAVVVVGYPATPIVAGRARFCMSAAHTREDLEYAIKHISIVGDRLQLKHSRMAGK